MNNANASHHIAPTLWGSSYRSNDVENVVGFQWIFRDHGIKRRYQSIPESRFKKKKERGLFAPRIVGKSNRCRLFVVQRQKVEKLARANWGSIARRHAQKESVSLPRQRVDVVLECVVTDALAARAREIKRGEKNAL